MKKLTYTIVLAIFLLVTAEEKGQVKTCFENVQSTKSLLLNKISTVQADNSNSIISSSLINFVNVLYTADSTSFQSQGDIDGLKVECYFYNYAPSLINIPSINWSSNTIKNYHLGDLFYDVSAKNSYRFSYVVSDYQWVLINSVDVIKVLSDASKEYGSLDTNCRIFISTPQPPYSFEDLWRQQLTGELKICIVEKLEGSYLSSDWIDSSEYTDNVVANITKAIANKAQLDATSILEELEDISDGGKITKSEKIKLKPIWDAIGLEKINLDAQVLLYPSSTMSTYYTIYGNAYNAVYTYLFVTILPNNISNPTPILGDLTKTTNITRDEFDDKFNDYYSARGELLQFIASSAKTYADTKASYLHIAFAYDSDGTVGFNFASGTYLGTYSDSSPTASSNPSMYVWNKITGTDGTPGTPGSNGLTPYFHVKYSDDGGLTFTSNSGETPGAYIGTYTDFYLADSTSVASYTWAKILDTQAMELLTEMADDSKLTATEKKVVKREWTVIYDEYNGIISSTSNYGVSDHTAYTNAHYALRTYIEPLLSNLTITSNIDRTVFLAKFQTYYAEKEALLNLFVQYSASSTNGKFDKTTIAPSGTTRLNYSGYFYPTKTFNAFYNDYAEYFLKDEEIEVGDVICKNPNGKGYIKSRYAYDNLVVGVYSDDFAQCIGGEGSEDDTIKFAPVGVAGRVRVKVAGEVKIGDLLVASETCGIAMASTKYISGTVIGKALENYSGQDVNRIWMLIMIS